MKKSKYAQGTSFIVEVCDAIRHHTGMRRALESQRENAFGDRDAALSDKREARGVHDADFAKACQRHSDAVEKIKSLEAQIKWHQSQLDDLVENADEPKLEILYEMPAEPDRVPASHRHQLTLATPPAPPHEPKARTPEPPAARPERRPVGRPKAELRPQDPALPPGEDQHLASPIVELELRDQLKVLCIDAGFSSIAGLARLVDGPDAMAAISEKVNVSTTDAGTIIAAVAAFRAKHRDAMRKVEAGGGGHVPDDRAKHGKGAGKAKRK
jgi:hypothetical protein